MQDEPMVSWEAEETAYYTVLSIDPDAPTRKNPAAKDVLHWLVVNVPGGDVFKGEIKA